MRIIRELYHSARHKTNVNYGNLMSDKEEKRAAKNLLCDLCLSSSWDKKDLLLYQKTFLAQHDDQHKSHCHSFLYFIRH